MGEYVDVILFAFFGFCLLAAALLVPVYRFLKREERDGEAFTREVEQRTSASNRAAPDPAEDPLK